MKIEWRPPPERRRRGYPIQLRFERQRVRMLLTALGLDSCEPALWKLSREKYGEPALLFSSFDTQFPTFPWALVAQSFYHKTAVSPLVNIGGWLRRFRDTFVWNWFKDHLLALDRHGSEEEKKRPIGMIFPLVVRGGLILHNGPCQTGDAKFSCDYWFEGVTHRCWVEPYRSWLRSIARSSWTPGTVSPTGREIVPRGSDRRGAWVDPWMMRCCGGIGPDSLVLAWLYRVMLGDPPSPYERQFLAREDGIRCVVATHAQLARELPPHTDRQIRTALSNLKKLGLVKTNQTLIRLVPEAIENAMTHKEASG